MARQPAASGHWRQPPRQCSLLTSGLWACHGAGSLPLVTGGLSWTGRCRSQVGCRGDAALVSRLAGLPLPVLRCCLLRKSSLRSHGLTAVGRITLPLLLPCAVAYKWDGVVHAEAASIEEAGVEYLTIRFE